MLLLHGWSRCLRHLETARRSTSSSVRLRARFVASAAHSKVRHRPGQSSRSGGRSQRPQQQPFPIELSAECKEPVLTLKRGKARLFYSGSPVIYGGAVERIVASRTPSTGDTLLVQDANGKPVCWGVYNKVSMYCVRVLQWQNELDCDASKNLEKIIESRIKQAGELRQALGLPSESTNVYRLVNRLSGLVVDIYDRTAVVSSTAAWIELNKECVIQSLKEIVGIQHVVWQPGGSMLSLEGFQPQTQDQEAETQGTNGSEEAPQATASVVESGIRYKVDLQHGQKTGFYIDQRDSRSLIRSLSQGKKILDLYCYTGGFSLAAAAGGALETTGVDSSAPAIALADESIEVAGYSKLANFMSQEVERYMAQAAKEKRTWDIVILDPPKLAPNRQALPAATRKYTMLNAAAMRLLKTGGLLMTCSCSGAVAQGEGLLPLVQEAAVHEGRKITLLRSAGPSADHPLDPAYPEGRYLTNLLFRVS